MQSNANVFLSNNKPAYRNHPLGNAAAGGNSYPKCGLSKAYFFSLKGMARLSIIV